jgi:hypothetical protein
MKLDAMAWEERRNRRIVGSQPAEILILRVVNDASGR